MNANVDSDLTSYDAQRQAFGKLLARFTADRDALIASVQECEERLSSLAERFESGTIAPNGSDGGPSATVVAEIRRDLENAKAELAKNISRARAEAQAAAERANEALARLESAADDARVPAEDVCEMRTSLEARGVELEALRASAEEHLESVRQALAGRATREEVDTVRHRLECIDEGLSALRQRFDEAAEQARQQKQKRVASGVSTPELQVAAIDDLRKQVRMLRSEADWAPDFQRVWALLVVSIIATAVFIVLGAVA